MSGCVDYDNKDKLKEQKLIDLQSRLEDLNQLYVRLFRDSQQSTSMIEKCLKEQAEINHHILNTLLDAGGQHDQLKDDDTGSSGLQFSFEAMKPQYVENSDDDSDTPLNKEKSVGDKPKSYSRYRHSVHTQTNLAIDPQTSVKLSFISAGLSSYGSTIEESFAGRTATRSATSQTGSHRHFVTPSTRHQQHQFDEGEDGGEFHRGDLRSEERAPLSRPPPVPSISNSSTRPPAPPVTPLRSILRTPTRASASDYEDTPPIRSGPLNAFSPALSPIHSIHSTLNYTDGTFQAHDVSCTDPHPTRPQSETERWQSSARPQYETSVPRTRDCDQSEASLQSISMLDMTGTTAATHRSLRPQVVEHQQNLSASKFHRTGSSIHFQPQVALSEEYNTGENRIHPLEAYNDTFGGGSHYIYGSNTPLRSSRGSGWNSRNSKTENLAPRHSQVLGDGTATPLSKKSSKFWRDRLGRRDMTSILGSPVSMSLFS